MLQIKNICKQYKTGNLVQQALNDVSLNLRDNEFVAILGPSGSGKTTLLNVIGGLDTYDSGDLIINGISTKKYKDRDWDSYRNHTIGFVFQSYNLIPHQTILSNVELALTISGISKSERRRRSLDALEQVGLKEHAHKKPNQLSGGQMQRVAIARALVNDPSILLADEPTGALDSDTSVQVMDLLKDVAKDRLVVMVTHNPELANDYATRIVDLRDGKICFDSHPFEIDDTVHEAAVYQNMGKTSMSLSTSLALSFNNLKTKKARTILTSFAGSIGIIGIALILSLSNGVNQYIHSIEEETLSEYPLVIQSSGFDMGAMLETQQKGDGEVELGDIKVANMLTNTFSKIGSNDLASLKKYFELHQDELDKEINSIEYIYNIQPQIFHPTTLRQVHPDQTFATLGMTSSDQQNNAMSSSMGSNVFYKLPEESSLYQEQYDMKAGHWPENKQQAVLVLNPNGKITDFMLYTLGLRDPNELDQMLQQFANQDKITISKGKDIYNYDEILGITFKVVQATQFYQYDDEYQIWRDKKDNQEYMHQLIDSSEDLEIVGIVQPKDDSTAKMLMPGIYYPASLTQHIIEEASKSKIVQEQLSHPTVNVLTGKAFDLKTSQSEFDMSRLFTINQELMKSAFKIDSSKINFEMNEMPPLDFETLLSQLEIKLPVPELEQLAKELLEGFGDYLQQNPDMNPSRIGEQLMEFMKQNEVVEYIRVQLEQAMIENDGKVTSDQLKAILEDVMNQYQDYIDENNGLDVEELQNFYKNYLNSNEAKQIVEKNMDIIFKASGLESQMNELVHQLSQNIQGQMSTMFAQLPQAFSFDEQAFAKAFEVKMTPEEMSELLISMMSKEKATYDGNLRKLGFAKLSQPDSISIYPKDFDSKARLLTFLDNYNEQMKQTNEEEKVISYSDIVGTLMSSVTDIIDVISYVLIAFIAISLVVSSIMIGVITYISVLERKKEIGILRAIGASKRNISQVFNAETFIIGLLSGVIGIVLTLLLLIPGNQIIHAVAKQDQINAALPFAGGVILIILSTILTLIGGIIPSRKAAKEDPVTALRTE